MQKSLFGNTRQTLLQRVESKRVTQVLFSSVTKVSFSVSYKGTAPADQQVNGKTFLPCPIGSTTFVRK